MSLQPNPGPQIPIFPLLKHWALSISPSSTALRLHLRPFNCFADAFALRVLRFHGFPGTAADVRPSTLDARAPAIGRSQCTPPATLRSHIRLDFWRPLTRKLAPGPEVCSTHASLQLGMVFIVILNTSTNATVVKAVKPEGFSMPI